MAVTWTAPGAEAISEFARQSSGVYLHATCVETATLEAAAAQDPAIYRLPPDQIGNYLQQMVNQWRAADPAVTAQGASYFGDAARWLTARGFRVDENVIDANWWQTLQDGLRNHQVFIVGVTNAQALPGDEAGVHNHGLCALGIDANGNIICGDPDNWKAQVNMPGSPIGVFVTYTQQDFINGQISSLTRVYPRMLTIADVSDHFTEVDANHWKCIQTGAVIDFAILAFYQSEDGLFRLGLPLANSLWNPGGHRGTEVSVFERGVVVYDPARLIDSPPGVTGQCYYGHVDSPLWRDVYQHDTAPVDPKAAPAEALADVLVQQMSNIGAYEAVK